MVVELSTRMFVMSLGLLDKTTVRVQTFAGLNFRGCRILTIFAGLNFRGCYTRSN